jgi:hypothetical protein
MASLPNTALETLAAGSSNPGGIINGNFERLEELLDPSLSSSDPAYNLIAKALSRTGTLPTANARLEWDHDSPAKPFWRANYAAVTFASSVAINFKGATAQRIALTGDLELTTSNLAPGRETTVILAADGTLRNLTFPAWVWLGTAPTDIAAGKTMAIRLLSTTSANTGVLASFDLEP